MKRKAQQLSTSDLQLVVDPSWVGGQHARVEELTPNLADDLRSSTLLLGIGHQGWLRFGIEISAKYLNGVALPYKLSFIDALEGVHAVVADGLLTDGEIIHNAKVWRARSRGH